MGMTGPLNVSVTEREMTKISKDHKKNVFCLISKVNL